MEEADDSARIAKRALGMLAGNRKSEIGGERRTIKNPVNGNMERVIPPAQKLGQTDGRSTRMNTEHKIRIASAAS